jgi:hypothetical protein
MRDGNIKNLILGPPLGSRYFKNVRLLQQDLSTLIRRPLEIVELKGLNLRIKQNLINKMKREDSIDMLGILVMCRRSGARPRPSLLDCREPRGPFRRAVGPSSTADHASDRPSQDPETFLPRDDSMRQLLVIKRPVSSMPIPDSTYQMLALSGTGKRLQQSARVDHHLTSES